MTRRGGFINNLAAQDDSYAAAMTTLAAIDAAQGHRPDALTKLNAVLAKHPRQTDARLLDARLLYLDGDLDGSLTQARALISNDPNSVAAGAAFLLTGRIESQRDRPGDAIRASKSRRSRGTRGPLRRTSRSPTSTSRPAKPTRPGPMPSRR